MLYRWTGIAILLAGPALAKETAEFEAKVKPFLKQYCYDCHGDGSAKGKVSLDDPEQGAQHLRHELWLRMWKNLRTDLMPPAKKDQPDPAKRREIVQWIERKVFRLDPAHPDPGRVTLRRLNREEYRHTIKDLLGVDYNVTEHFAPDDTSYGFDTIGDVLSISPLMMEKYLAAAVRIMAKADAKRILPDGPPPEDAGEREKYARKILEHFATRAYRRPVEKETVDKLLALAESKESESFEAGIRFALTAVLSSPPFLLRGERPAKKAGGGKAEPIDDYALASRLSYFLWSSTPDEDLLKLAGEGTLHTGLRATVDRMLKDPKSERFVRHFTGQWLQTRNLDGKFFDTPRITGTDGNKARNIFNLFTRQNMRRETELLFAHLVEENRPAIELITADYSFVNDRLAKFYGIEDFKGKEFRKVSLEGTERGGILTHGSFLITTSNPNRTSPVKRGLFVLDNLLGIPPPPPPPDIPELEAARKKLGKDATVREMLEHHRAQPLCHSCHARMDPIGLALEHYNAIGQWRGGDEAKRDTSGVLVTGEKFAGIPELRQILAGPRKKDVHRCLTEKLLTYALGRAVEYYDAPAVDGIIAKAEKAGGGMREFLFAVTESAPFQLRRTE